MSVSPLGVTLVVSHLQQQQQWGAAAGLGVYHSPDSKTLVLGNTLSVRYDNAVDFDQECPAAVAPGPLPGRHKWCTDPRRCWAAHGWEAHKRPTGISDDACKGAKLPDDFDWDSAVTIAAPSPVNIGNLRPLLPGKGGREGKGGGAGGKGGGGKGGGKGRGSLKGKGKGGGGKGKGKGGKGGGAPFGRQRY